MVYTEIRKLNRRLYYYRVISIRKVNKITKKRIYLGYDLPSSELSKKEGKADEQLLPKKLVKSNKGIKKIKLKIVSILKKYNVKKAGIFGSYSRGEQKYASDIDIAVDIKDKNMSLLDFIGLKLKLEDALGKKVDLVEYNSIKPRIKDEILKEEIRII